MRVNGTMLDLLRHLADKWRILSSFLDRFPRVDGPLYEKIYLIICSVYYT